jgi:phosphatidate cytidylyltransferase
VSNLGVRVLTAAVAIPILVAAAICPRPEAVWMLVFAFTLAGLDEFFRMTLPDAPRFERLRAIAAGGAFAAACYWCPDRDGPLLVLTVPVMGVLAARLFDRRDLREGVARAGVIVLGMLYVGLLFTPLALLRLRPSGVGWVALALGVTFMNDTAAYFAGRFWGRHKLHPRVSPGKTVEGALGGAVGAVLAAVLCKLWLLSELRWIDCVLLGLPGAALGQVGDLCESMIKRGAGVKDSGWILPGHGGVLDRIDGLLFVAPYVYAYARFAAG